LLNVLLQVSIKGPTLAEADNRIQQATKVQTEASEPATTAIKRVSGRTTACCFFLR
ncbi:unnamed protein product, partial [Porites lobata]